MPSEKTFPETAVNDADPLQVRVLGQADPIPVQTTSLNYEFKSIIYADHPTLVTGLATETAANWEPVSVTNFVGAVGEDLVVLYRRVVA